MLGCDIMDIKFSIATPKVMEFQSILQLVKKHQPEICNEPEEAVKNADVIYTDTWVSMGLKTNFSKD